MWRRFILGSCLLFFITQFAFATAQVGDILLLNGKKYSIDTNPLESYLTQYPEKRPESKVVRTSNWRGYVATWEVKKNTLVLKDVEILVLKKDVDFRIEMEPAEYRPALPDIFPGQKEVVAEWYKGHIIIPTGKLVKYVHMGYGSTYKKYIILRIEAGLVTKSWKENLSEFKKFRKSQFEAFKKTKEFQKAFEESKKESPNMKEGEIEEFLFEFYSERYLSLIFDTGP
jgi:hypothetical protein